MTVFLRSFYLLFFFMVSVNAAEKKPIPDPLDLSTALLFAEKTHPNLSIADSNISLAANAKDFIQSHGDLKLSLESRLQYIEPSSIATNQDNDDHRIGLVASKSLYDSGRLNSQLKYADFTIKSERLKKIHIINKRKLEIKQRFYDVVLADMNFYRYNEEMATKFIAFDRTRDRLEIGQRADIDVMQLDVDYKKARYLRIKSQNEQRISRTRLAIAMGRPSELVNTVSKPKRIKKLKSLPELEVLNKVALEHNYTIALLKNKLSAAYEAVQLAKKTTSPTINFEATGFEYSRQLQNRPDFQVGVVMRIPLFAGRTEDLAVSKALSKVDLIKSEIELAKSDVLNSIVSHWFEFEALEGKLLQMEALTDYREIYLDRSRALYELEVKTDLGDAMARVSEAERDYLKTQFQMQIVRSKIELEVGKTLSDIIK